MKIVNWLQNELRKTKINWHLTLVFLLSNGTEKYFIFDKTVAITNRFITRTPDKENRDQIQNSHRQTK